MESNPAKFKSFQRKNFQLRALQKLQNSIHNPYSFVARLPDPSKLSILGNVWRATILPFPSSKYFFSWLRLLNIIDLSFKYLSFSIKQKTNRSSRSSGVFAMGYIAGLFWAFCVTHPTPPRPPKQKKKNKTDP